MLLSVILPTRDRARLLEQALRALAEQTLPPQRFEVLVVDNGSTDDTRTVAEVTPGVRYVFEPKPGLHAGRHRGLKEATGDILVYADDDTRAMPGWLAAIAENFTDAAVALVGGNNYPDFLAPPPDWLARLWREPYLGGHAISLLSVLELPEGRREISPLQVWGCNFAIRRQVLLDAGGFHPDAMPPELIRFRGDGETHVSQAIAARGLRCMFDSRASVRHAVPQDRMTFDYFRRRAYLQGISYSYSRLRAGESPETPPRTRARAQATAEELWLRLRQAGPHARPLRELREAIAEGRREGIAFHHRAYREDPEVRRWVHQADYF
jgi:glycosyltransferase involved in cell wall biosynthesis